MKNSEFYHKKILYGGGVLCAGLVAFGLPSICQAETTYTDSVSVTISSSCELSQTGSGNYSLTLTPGGASGTIAGSEFSVSCNDSAGWRLMAVGWNGTAIDTNLTHETDNTIKIATGLNTTSGGPRSWAMKLTTSSDVTLDGGFVSDTFKEIPNSATRIAYSDTNTSGSTITTTYQAYASSTQVAGTYTGGVKYTLEHPAVDPDITTIVNMQDMTSAVCDNSTVGQTNQLKDTRDNKLYWVAKLADGNCWMTQNLDYDLSDSTLQTLSPDTSDVASQVSVVPVSWETGYNSIYFYEGGDNYLPNGSGSATSTSSLASNSDNWHYHVGNYYSWKAATAGSGTTSITSADAPDSICPKGWRLPTSNSTTANYSFGKLLTAYSYSSSSDSILLASPLWFVRAGYVYNGSLDGQGSYGYVWSSRAYSNSDGAYGLGFSSSVVDPSYSDDRYSGNSVRCVAE